MYVGSFIKGIENYKGKYNAKNNYKLRQVI
ncbi:hypothetical protein AVENLUH8758_01186 [Acinetobacter venetianus]|nr:hypothetical protein AVENLUH8758_01186 [Acinetobacter venetianus]